MAQIRAPFYQRSTHVGYNQGPSLNVREGKFTPLMKTVLILEDDLGFVCWLGQILAEGGYQPLPARSAPDATALLEELQVGVDALIVNPALPGAVALIEWLCNSNRYLKLVGLIGEERERDPSVAGIHAWSSKPCEAHERAKSEWLETVGGLFLSQGAGNSA